MTKQSWKDFESQKIIEQEKPRIQSSCLQRDKGPPEWQSPDSNPGILTHGSEFTTSNQQEMVNPHIGLFFFFSY